jgi:hypothetical protein
MHTQIIVNLPVKDLKRSRDFFTKLGYAFDAQSMGEQAARVLLGDNLSVMLLTEPFFQTLTSKSICETTQATEFNLCVTCSSREQVDRLICLARANGAKSDPEAQDHGFMYAQGYEDLDGHAWQLIHMATPPPA